MYTVRRKENIQWLCRIWSLLNSAKCNCTMSSVFKNKVSLYRIYFCSSLYCKSKFCQNGSLSLYTLTSCDYDNVSTAVKIKMLYIIQKSLIHLYTLSIFFIPNRSPFPYVLYICMICVSFGLKPLH